MLQSIVNNPYRILGVLSNSPLRERVANLNRLNAFAKIGKEVVFPNDFTEVLSVKPSRSVENISEAGSAINLDKDQLKHALLWFVNGSPMDDVALKHLQSGNVDKAKDIFQKRETYSSLINGSILAFAENDIATGFGNISKVIHTSEYFDGLLQALGLSNLSISEEEIAQEFIKELLKDIPAERLLRAASNTGDRGVIGKIALEEPISSINSAISTAKSVASNDANANLVAGKRLMSTTKKPLSVVKEIVGASSPQYQMVADNLAKQILQCGINYYNNASDDDIESPRKAMELQEYALRIAVGKLTKDRCQENYDILKKAVDNMPPAEVAVETGKIKDELKKFCQLPDKISHAITLLNNTRPLLQAIKAKLGDTNKFYLALSTQVVGNALHNVIEDVNSVLNRLNRAREEFPFASSVTLIINKVTDVLKEAWTATLLMDVFDMESDFKTERYNPNRKSLKRMCDKLGVVTSTPPPSSIASYKVASSTQPVLTTPTNPSKNLSSNQTKKVENKKDNEGWGAYWITVSICAILGAIANGEEGFFVGAFFGAIFVGNLVRAFVKEN